MKTNKVLLMIPLLFTMIMGITGCEDESAELIWEISPQNGQTFIQQEVDGIVFKFCLLNEKDEPSTIFNEKENITFRFLIENKLKNDISVPTDFIDSDFFRVYKTINNADMGKPWTGLWCNYSLSDKKINIASSEISRLNCPWILTENRYPDYPICMSESKDYLPVGNYYTFIRLDFYYFQGNEQKVINNGVFKINFKIQ